MSQDYILRLIQQIMAMIASIAARRKQGDLDGAAAEIEERCVQHIGLPLVVVRQSTPVALEALLAMSGARKHERALLLAELLLQSAELAELRGNPPLAALDYRHAWKLINDSAVVLIPSEQAIYRAKLEFIATKLRDLDGGSPPPESPRAGPG
jgi:hypothetical protein